MKTTIYISGQPSGNSILVNAIGGDVTTGSFGSFYCTFSTKKEAKKSLSNAKKILIENEPEYRHGISYSPGYSLSYDASRAEIRNY